MSLSRLGNQCMHFIKSPSIFSRNYVVCILFVAHEFTMICFSSGVHPAILCFKTLPNIAEAAEVAAAEELTKQQQEKERRPR